jgi:DNA-binding winged helix-turn-helix (wHTH) protein
VRSPNMLYKFENYVLDPKRRELRRGSEPVHVEPQAFDLLVHLICNRERMVSKDDLIKAIWKGRPQLDSVVDNCISKARRAIGDNGTDQRLIQTVKRRGARFSQDVLVQEVQPSAPPSQVPAADVPPASIEAGQPSATANAADDTEGQGSDFISERTPARTPAPPSQVPAADVPPASIEAGQPSATANAADDTEGQGLDFISERTPILSDTTLRYLAIVDALALVGCVFARAPSELSINAGYILVFGPMLLLLASAWVAVRGHRATGRWQRADLHLARILFSLPAVTSAFLALQFFLLLAPPGECPTFLRWKYLTDFSIKAVKPEYCMGLDAQVQAHGPWLISPVILQAWFQVFAPIVTAVLCFRAFRAWHSAVEIQRDEYTERERN